MQQLSSLALRIDDALPQTQCTRCGYPNCRAYAQAIAEWQAPINQCPPGGEEGVRRLAEISGQSATPLNPMHGTEGQLHLARIDEPACIGCTLCLDACPVDCIVGGPKAMHTVIETLCTGCGLCLPVCPVDCIQMLPQNEAATGWAAWSQAQAAQAHARYAQRLARRDRDHRERDEAMATLDRLRANYFQRSQS